MKNSKAHKIGTLEDAQKTAISALAVIGQIRGAVGDTAGKLMLDELIEHCRAIAQKADILEAAKRAGDMLEPYAREHASAASEQAAEEWRNLTAHVEANRNRAEEIIRAREETIARQREKIERLSTALRDAISTYDPNRASVLVTAERQEAWIEALNY